jgi:TonB dependent receptor
VQNQITFQPSINTVDEFKVDNSTYSAEEGRNSGAIVNIATRGGSNTFHGEGFEFLRNDALDARNYFNRGVNGTEVPKAPFKRNNFGASIGGPIIKNKTFFFASYEGLRQRQGLVINATTFSNVERQEIAAAGNPAANQILSLIAPANSGASSFVGSTTAPVNIDQWTGDVQHHFSDADSLHVYYAVQRDRRQEPTLQYGATPALPGWGDVRTSRRQIATINETHIFSPRLTNEARVGFNRIHIVFSPFQLLDPSTLGIADGVVGPLGIPQIRIQDPGITGDPNHPQLNFAFGGPAGFPQGRGDVTGVLSDTVGWLSGKHSFKFGGEARRFTNNNFVGDAGTLVFNCISCTVLGPTGPGTTGQVPDGFARGLADQFAITPGNQPSRIGINAVGAFVEDNWKLTQSLTLDLGLRYDWNGTPTEAENRFVVYDPTTNSLVQTGQPYKQNHNFEPRVGFAYDMFHNGKTVLRAGYAYMSDQPVSNTVTPLASNPPFTSPISFAASKTAAPLAVTNLTSPIGAGGVAPANIDENFRNALVSDYNVNIQQQVTPTVGVMIGYFGSKASHLRLTRNLNQILPSGLRPIPRLSPNSPIDPNALLGNVQTIDDAGNANYNALWISANKRTSHGFQFNGSYTFSKSLDYNSLNSQGQVIQNSLNPRDSYGLSDFDARHRFVFNGIYDLPFKSNRLISGWELSGILQLQTGNPITILTANTFTGNATIRPDLIGSIAFPNTLLPNGNIQYFSGTTCTTPTAGCTFLNTNTHFGDMARNSIIGPGFANLDFSFIKNTKLSERFTHQFRAEMFDLTNHPNFGQPSRILGGTLGQIASTRFPTGDSGSSRQIQFAMKLIF